MFKSEYDLHCKVVDFIRNKYEEALMIAGLGENQKNKISRIKILEKKDIWLVYELQLRQISQ